MHADHLTPTGEDAPLEGFTAYQSQGATHLLDANGDPVGGAPVEVVAFNGRERLLVVRPGIETTLLTESAADRFVTFETELLDWQRPGLTMTDVEFGLIDFGPAVLDFLERFSDGVDVWLQISRDASGLLAIDGDSLEEETFSAPVHLIELDSGQTVAGSIIAPSLPSIGFSQNGEFLIYHDALEGSVRILDIVEAME